MERNISRWSVGLGALVLWLLAVPGVVAQTSQADAKDEGDARMATDADPSFLVATIRPSDPAATGGWSFESEGRRIGCVNATVATIIRVAYGIHETQILGGPKWLSKDTYDVHGVPDVAGVPDLNQTQEMYQKLLAERFHLSFHREMRDIPIYALTVGKGGPLLKVAGPKEELNAGSSGGGGQRVMKFSNMSMLNLALNLNLYEDRPVIDKTGLPGQYDFTLRWTDDIAKEGDPNAAPSLFTAIKEQLGLRMDAVKGQAEVLVIDDLERPSAN